MIHFFLYKLAIFIARAFPRKVVYRISAFTSDIFYNFKKSRFVVQKNLEIILGKADKRVKPYSRAVFRSFGYYLADFLRFSQINQEFISKYVEIEGRKNLDKTLANSRSAIGIGAHVGNWELGGMVLARLVSPLNLVVWTHKNKRINDFFIKRRGSSGAASIPLERSVRLTLEALKRREIVALLGDVNFKNPQNGICVDFFKHKAYLPEGPAVFALKTGAPIFFGFLIRNPENYTRYKFIFDGPLLPDSSGDHQQDIKRLTQEIAVRLERVILKYPQQWFMVNNIWCD